MLGIHIWSLKRIANNVASVLHVISDQKQPANTLKNYERNDHYFLNRADNISLSHAVFHLIATNPSKLHHLKNKSMVAAPALDNASK